MKSNVALFRISLFIVNAIYFPVCALDCSLVKINSLTHTHIHTHTPSMEKKINGRLFKGANTLKYF